MSRIAKFAHIGDAIDTHNLMLQYCKAARITDPKEISRLATQASVEVCLGSITHDDIREQTEHLLKAVPGVK